VLNRRLALALLSLSLSLLAVPAAAVAQDSLPAPDVAVKTTIKLSGTNLVNRAVLSGSPWTVKGTVSSYVPGQSVELTVLLGSRTIVSRTLPITDGGGVGSFALPLDLGGSGRLTIRARHTATAEMAGAEAKPIHVTLVRLYAKSGSHGLAVSYLQRRLAALGYVVGRRGYYDARTGRAVLAFRKLTRMKRIYVADGEVFRRLASGWGRFKVRYPGQGRHVEADLTHQVLALIDHGKAVRIYPLSSGKPSTPTILGNFTVYMKEPGTNGHGMIYSSYFIRGYAIHGYVEVPVYPASHGCLRIPPPDAISVYNWVHVGTPVDTYYR